MKRLIFSLVLTCVSFSFCHAAEGFENKEILLRIPLLSGKNSVIITNSLDELKGIKKIEACYQVNVMIIGYDSNLIKDDSVILDALKNIEINSPIEKIYSKDISTIRSNYKITTLRDYTTTKD